MCRTLRLSVASLAVSLGLLSGCATNTETAQRDTLTENVGNYSAPPAVSVRPRVGVPSFKVEGDSAGDRLNDLAADQATTLLANSDRFVMIERAQLGKLLDEQNLEGIVKPGELAKPGQVRGVDYLLIGRVTNFRVKTVRNERGLGLGRIGGGMLGSAGLGEVKNTDITIKTDCGIDLRLVDPTTGEIKVAMQSEYTKSDNAGAMGVDILGANATSDVEMKIDDDNKGKILRLAIDDALRKNMPRIDRFLTSLPAK